MTRGDWLLIEAEASRRVKVARAELNRVRQEAMPSLSGKTDSDLDAAWAEAEKDFEAIHFDKNVCDRIWKDLTGRAYERS